MIAFSCPHCGMKLQVKPQFAGRSAPCPTCKQRLTVPAADATQAYAPAGPLDGTASSLAQAGLDAGVTLASGGAVSEVLARRTQKGQRYSLGGEIARSGMGAVLRAVDCDIRREVAIKYMLDQGDASKKLRFVEEAQITGQLEHPNIVPIHELGVDRQQRLFFAMKMVKGRSLAQVIDDLRQTPRAAEKEWTLNRLLNIFVNVCHALAYAHARNVIHRDLKPANIMLGDFGEVYVMDWGLAKVLASGGRKPPEDSAVAATALSSGGLRPPLAGSVQTSREAEADLTQEGTVLGTPVYMPPEQAAGRLDAIDQRSDVYSLGAILYELLTLQAPIDRSGGHMSVLIRVVEGAIVAPEQRDPGRTKAGKVPRELAAVAMKALAKEAPDRYANVEALRRDVERFQEGRSVSAKEDTRREIFVKFVRRNQGFSAGMAATFVVLLGSLWFIGKAWLVAQQAQSATDVAYQAYRNQVKKSVPAFVQAADLWVERNKLDAALNQVDIALQTDPEHAPARLLRGQLHIVRQDFAAARADLNEYLKSQPDDANARRLADLCRTAKANDVPTMFAFADVFRRQKADALVQRLYESAGGMLAGRKELLVPYQKQIEAAWPGLGSRLAMDAEGRFGLNLDACAKQVLDLKPLRGIPLNDLSIFRCDRVSDLTPLKGMPLTTLNLSDCIQVRDLAPLQGLPLTTLNLHNCVEVRDLKPLKGMKLTELDLASCNLVQDLTPLQGMKLTTLSLFNLWKVRDLSLLQGMRLTSLSLPPSTTDKDLTLLKGMPLTSLNLIHCGNVHDLSALKGLPLTELGFRGCGFHDLEPLRGMKLTSLNLNFCSQVRDLTPLRGMPLTNLVLAGCDQVQDLVPLKGMPLTYLQLHDCGQLRDLSPLQGLPLEAVWLTPKNITKGMDGLRQMKRLKTISVGDKQYDAGEFWKKYDAGEFK